MTDKEFVNLQRVGLTLGRPLTLPFLQCQLLNLIHSQRTDYNVPLVKTQMKKIIVTAKTLYSHPKNVSKIYAALHTDLAW